MTTRLLPRAEWGRLQGTEMELIAAAAAQTGVEILIMVVEDQEGAIIGCWSLFPVWHAEGLWIAPTHRGKASVARRLFRYAAHIARDMGIGSLYTAAYSAPVASMLDAVAHKLPGSHYVLPLAKVNREEVCPRVLQFH